RRNQTRHGTRGEEEDELVILDKPRSHLCGKGSVIGAIPGCRGRSIARRPGYFTSLEPLAQVPGALNSFLGGGNQSNLWCRFHALHARKINMGLSDSRRCRGPRGLAWEICTVVVSTCRSCCWSSDQACVKFSSVIQCMTSRPPGCNLATAAGSSSASRPPLPPTNMAWGSGKVLKASGASPSTGCTLLSAKACTFASTCCHACRSLSMANI